MEIPQTSSKLNAIHGLSSNDLYVAGNGGLLMHFDGSAWKTIPTNTAANFVDVFVLNESEVWVAGEMTLLKGNHREGFKTMRGAESFDYERIWARSSTEVFLSNSMETYTLIEGEWVQIKRDAFSSILERFGGAVDFARHPDGGTWLITDSELAFSEDALAWRKNLGVRKTFKLLVSEPLGDFWVYSPGDPKSIIHVIRQGQVAVALPLQASTGGPELADGQCSEQGEVWFVSKLGELLVWDGSQMQRSASNEPLDNRKAGTLAFWGASPRDLWAVSSEGKVFRRYAP